MRIGQNPLRESKVTPPSPVQFCVVTHLPNTESYHEYRLDVIKLCLMSMRKHCGIDGFEVMVFDNGSCDALIEWLINKYKPNTLILSKNIGKTAARTSAIRMVNPKSVVCYSDDDIYYGRDWFIPQLSLLQSFPNTMLVTGYAIRQMFRWGTENTLKWCRENARVESGKFIPEAWCDDYAISIGRSPERNREMTVNDNDYRVTYNGVVAYATGHHCQFIGYASRLIGIAGYDGDAMGDEAKFDIAADQHGLRLATTERLTRHIGNQIDESVYNQAKEEGMFGESES